MKILSIGFTQKNAEKFFGLLKNAGVVRLIDVRLNNVSQLSGFAKKDDLKFFLKEICDIDYMHIPDLAPTKEILDPYKKGNITWDAYADKFLNLMAKRNIEKHINISLFDNGCLLCSEHKPHNCHRKLVIDYLTKHTNENILIEHLY